MNVITVKINGHDYNLKGEENIEYLETIAKYVDAKLKSILKSNRNLSISSAAVLTALNATDELFKGNEIMEKLKQEIDEASKKEKDLTTEVESLKAQVKNLQSYNRDLLQRQKGRGTAFTEASLKDEVQSLKEKLTELQEDQDEKEKQSEESNKLLNENKELRSQIQSAKYKIVELQNELMENDVK